MSRLYPGPLATMLMGDLGADVIKFEDLNSPDYMRLIPPFAGGESAGYLAVNRSKRSLACDSRSDKGKELFFRLVATADLVVEQFRPGVLDKMGLGYEAALRYNPRIIYVSLTGYGQTGPYAAEAGHDLNYIGYAGILGVTGTAATPIIPGPQIADVAGGAYLAVIAAMSALWSREKSGEGQHVDVSMLDGVLPLMTLQMAHHWCGESSRRGRMALSGELPCYGVYRCADGKFIALAALEEKFWNNFCELVRREEWKSLHYDMGERENLRVRLQALFATKSREEWVRLAAGKDVCLTPVLEPAEVENDAHLRAREMFGELSHPTCGNIKCLGVPVKFSKTTARPSLPPPLLGEHTVDILREIGYSEREIGELRERKIIEIG